MMKDAELERLRAAYAAPPPGALETGSHPEPDRIWQAVRGELPPEEIREIVDHVALCASCAEDWRIAMAFEKESRDLDEKPVMPRRFSTSRFQPWIAAAAAVLAVAIGLTQIQKTPEPPAKPEYRQEQVDEIRSLAGQTVPRDACVLPWTPVEGAESYDLTVTFRTATVIADVKRLTTPSYQVPASALAALPSGSRLDWRVTAVFPDGARKQSPSFTTVLQ